VNNIHRMHILSLPRHFPNMGVRAWKEVGMAALDGRPLGARACGSEAASSPVGHCEGRPSLTRQWYGGGRGDKGKDKDKGILSICGRRASAPTSGVAKGGGSTPGRVVKEGTT